MAQAIPFNNTSNNGDALPRDVSVGPDSSAQRTWFYNKTHNKWVIGVHGPNVKFDGQDPIVMQADDSTIVTSIDLDTISTAPEAQ